METSHVIVDMPGSLQLLACDAWMRSMHYFLLVYQVIKGEPFDSHTWPNPLNQPWCLKTSVMRSMRHTPKQSKQELYYRWQKPRLAGSLWLTWTSGDVEDCIHTFDIVEFISKKCSDILGEYVQLWDNNCYAYVLERATPCLKKKPGKAVIVKDRVYLTCCWSSNGWHTIMW